MGRYATLNPSSQDQVDVSITGIKENFGLSNILDAIPSDIRMRTWDCERKEWVYDAPDEDARNWGLQFVKDLLTISRIKKNDGGLAWFHDALHRKIGEHEDNHPWVRLQDIKDLKNELDPPKRFKVDPTFLRKEEESDTGSEDSYFEELVPIEGSARKRGRNENEKYESRKMKDVRKRPKRLRRDSEEGWARPVKKGKNYAARDAVLNSSPMTTRVTPTPSVFDDNDYNGMSVEEMEINLQLAEAEVKANKLKLLLAEKKRKAGATDTSSVAPSSVAGSPPPVHINPNLGMTSPAPSNRYRTPEPTSFTPVPMVVTPRPKKNGTQSNGGTPSRPDNAIVRKSTGGKAPRKEVTPRPAKVIYEDAEEEYENDEEDSEEIDDSE